MGDDISELCRILEDSILSSIIAVKSHAQVPTHLART
jgi:hypothetical protein